MVGILVCGFGDWAAGRPLYEAGGEADSQVKVSSSVSALLGLRCFKEEDIQQAAGTPGGHLGRDAWVGTLIWDTVVTEDLLDRV